MPDTEASGDATADAATTTTNTPDNPSTKPQPGSTFGQPGNRGSGLARGKRAATSSPPAASGASALDYKPTAVSILNAPTEYKNPFAPVETPAAPAEAPAPTPASATPAPGLPSETTPVFEVPAATPPGPASQEPAKLEADTEEARRKLSILPPEKTKRVEHNWESESFRSAAGQPAAEPRQTSGGEPAVSRPRREERSAGWQSRGDRPTFRPQRERREDRSAGFRGEPQPTGEDFTALPKAAEPKKSGGFFAWVKKLFGGATTEEKEAQPDESREFSHRGNRRRRRRGGRDRHFHGDQPGSQGGGQSHGGYQGQGGDYRHHGRHRRRRRDGGHRGGPRPEGGPPTGS